MGYNNSSGGCGAIIFGALVLLIIAAKALLYILAIGLAVWLLYLLVVQVSRKECRDYIRKYWRQILLILGLVGLFVLFVWGVMRCGRGQTETILTDSISDTVKTEPIDTAQIIADQRKDSIFEGNIFAGLRFGISKGEYERLIKKFKREYDNKIVFPDEKGNVLSYGVSWIEPKFYRGKLYEVEVRIDNYHAYYELEPIFEQKYGITKFNRWEWQNAEIRLSSVSHRAYDPSGDKGYGSSFSGWYYSSSGSKYLTREPGHTTITYQDLTLYNLEHKEKLRNDSIKEAKEQAAREKRKQREREKANRYRENI